MVRTGVTMVVPRHDQIWTDYASCGCFSFSGNGEMTGLPWIDESGLLGSAIGITNTHQVGLVRDAMVRYGVDRGLVDGFMLPVVAETYDGWLSDIDAVRAPINRRVLGSLRNLLRRRCRRLCRRRHRNDLPRVQRRDRHVVAGG